MAWSSATLFDIRDCFSDYAILKLEGQVAPTASWKTTPLSPRLERCSKAGSGLLGRSAPEGLLNSSHPMRWLFCCLEEMSEQENYNGMLEFWEDLITLANRREDYVALRNIPTDIYMMLGYDVKAMLGEASTDEQDGHILSDCCYRAEAHIYDGD